MYTIKTLNAISPVGLAKLPANQFEIDNEAAAPQGILVRSADMHDAPLPDSLLAIARAGAGTNNIPVEDCTNKGIVVFNTPGANANAVKELVIAGLLLSSRKISDAIDWAKGLKGKGAEVGKLVEKGKSAFAGPEIKGKTLGVIGLGAIGVLVANAAQKLGMKVYGYDPYLSVDAAWGLSSAITHAQSLSDIYANCDYITVHVPLTPETKGMINAESIATMKQDVRILNFARGDLVNDADILAALKDGKVARYITDFPNDTLIGEEGVIAIPHLGASTPESEDNCASMAANELMSYLEDGIIINSVNLPTVDAPRIGTPRICVIHKNIPNMLSQMSSAVSDEGINIESMLNKSKKDYAYTIMDVVGDPTDAVVEKIQTVDGVIRVRVIR